MHFGQVYLEFLIQLTHLKVMLEIPGGKFDDAVFQAATRSPLSSAMLRQ